MWNKSALPLILWFCRCCSWSHTYISGEAVFRKYLLNESKMEAMKANLRSFAVFFCTEHEMFNSKEMKSNKSARTAPRRYLTREVVPPLQFLTRAYPWEIQGLRGWGIIWWYVTSHISSLDNKGTFSAKSKVYTIMILIFLGSGYFPGRGSLSCHNKLNLLRIFR